jgi:actin related protein 2/3 complex, subunit 2
VLHKRHVTGRNKVEECTWRLCTFYGFINYHIKCSKAHMHTRMRRRAMGLLQVLNRAKPDVQKTAKKADGRTFVRNI